MTKPSKKLSNQRSSIAKARKSRHTRQKSPSPWPSPTPNSNYSISAPSTPPESAISTPASHPTSEIDFGDLEILDQWPNDGEHSPLDLADVSDSEDEEEGYHSDDLLHTCRFAGEFAQGTCISGHFHHSEVGAQNDQMDGSLQRW